MRKILKNQYAILSSITDLIEFQRVFCSSHSSIFSTKKKQTFSLSINTMNIFLPTIFRLLLIINKTFGQQTRQNVTIGLVYQNYARSRVYDKANGTRLLDIQLVFKRTLFTWIKSINLFYNINKKVFFHIL